MRCIGIVTLPLLLPALRFGRRSGLLAPLFATYFLCTFVLPYTYWLDPFQYLFDHVPMLRNIRAMANTMPRDVPAVLAALLAGMGLDAFLAARRTSRSALVPICALVVTLCAGILALVPTFLPMRHSLAHIAVYLGISSLILLGVAYAGKPATRTRFAGLLLLVTFADLAVSSSHYLAEGRLYAAEGGDGASPGYDTIRPDQDRVGELVRRLFRARSRDRAELQVRPALLAGVGEPRAMAFPLGKLESPYRQNDRISGPEILPFQRIRDIDELAPPDPETTFYIHDEAALAGLDRSRASSSRQDARHGSNSKRSRISESPLKSTPVWTTLARKIRGL
jgi:hypothetical protein